MTTKDGYYGSDDVENRFSDPKTNEAYFTLINEKTGEIEVYNEEFGADKRVGTISPDGSVDFNDNWWGGANKNDRAFVEAGIADGSIVNHASDIVQQESDLTDAETKILLDGKNGTAEDFASGLSELQSDTIGSLGEDRAGTRNKFGNHVFPTSIDPGQDVLKFNMMKYVPKKFDQEQFGFEDRETKGRSIGSVILPIPAGIGDAQAVSWGGNSMSAVQAAIAQAALDAITKSPQEGVDSLLNSAQKVAGNSGEASTALANTLAGMASGSTRFINKNHWCNF